MIWFLASAGTAVPRGWSIAKPISLPLSIISGTCVVPVVRESPYSPEKTASSAVGSYNTMETR
jgi:hypothetical protein